MTLWGIFVRAARVLTADIWKRSARRAAARTAGRPLAAAGRPQARSRAARKAAGSASPMARRRSRLSRNAPQTMRWKTGLTRLRRNPLARTSGSPAGEGLPSALLSGASPQAQVSRGEELRKGVSKVLAEDWRG
jgi:hypothetical protein